MPQVSILKPNNDRPQANRSTKIDVSRIKSVMESERIDDNESEYYRASECERTIAKAQHVVLTLKEDLANEKAEKIALTEIKKELIDRAKRQKFEIESKEKELEHYRNKINSKAPNKKLSENKIMKLFEKDDDQVNKQAIKRAEILLAKYRNEIKEL